MPLAVVCIPTAVEARALAVVDDPIAVELSPLAVFVTDSIPLPLVALKLKGKLVSCEPSPIKAGAVTLPAMVVVPSNKTSKALERCPS